MTGKAVTYLPTDPLFVWDSGHQYLVRQHGSNEKRVGRLIHCHPHDGACYIFESIEEADPGMQFFAAEKSDVEQMVYYDPPFRVNFQDQVGTWTRRCFGIEIAMHRKERMYRFAEEVAELMQAGGVTFMEFVMLALRTYSRPMGDVRKEIGQVLLTFAALCHAFRLDMMKLGEAELVRVSEPELMKKIKAKHDSKPHPDSPYPGDIDTQVQAMNNALPQANLKGGS